MGINGKYSHNFTTKDTLLSHIPFYQSDVPCSVLAQYVSGFSGPLILNCLSAYLKRDILIHSRLHGEDETDHYTSCDQNSSGAAVLLVKLPRHVGCVDHLGLACLDVKTWHSKTAMEACGTLPFALCQFSSCKQVVLENEWLRCHLCCELRIGRVSESNRSYTVRKGLWEGLL